jgi:succinate dehydrogenase / fumarate reductase cytochrome b subunit
MAKVDEAVTPAGPHTAPGDGRTPAPAPVGPVPYPRPQGYFLLRFWRSGVGKKWVMGVSGIILLGYVLAHMIGTLKVFLGKTQINRYADWLRTLGEPALPRTVVLWTLRSILILAAVLHVLAAYQLTRMNRRARPVGYQAPRDYVAANFASRTMRWTGVIVLAFLVFHLLDQTWGPGNSHFVRGDPYDNLFYSFTRVPVAVAYIVAMAALCFHIFHGAWSLFQSLGWNNPRWNQWRRYFAVGFAAIIFVGYTSMPLLIVTKAVTR